MIIIWRLARAGLVAALIVGLSGWALERARFGSSDQEALHRVEAELRRRLDASAETLASIAARATEDRDAIRTAAHDASAQRRLFDAADRALPERDDGRTGVTIYDASATAVGWAGRVTDSPKNTLTSPTPLFVAAGPFGPRLVHVQPIVDGARTPARLGTVVAEQWLAPLPPPGGGDAAVLTTSIGPVSVRAPSANGGDRESTTVVIPAQGGGTLVDVELAPQDLAAARARWRSGTWAAVWSVLAVTLLLVTGPLLEARRRMRDRRGFILMTVGVVLILITARLVFWFAAAPIVARGSLMSPLDLLLNALLLTALTWIVLDLVERGRTASPRPALLAPGSPAIVWLTIAYAAAGAVDIWLLTEYEGALQRIVSSTTLDLLHFSLHPVSAARLAIAFALVLMHASVIWASAAIIRLPSLIRRTPRRAAIRLLIAGGWIAGVAVGLAFVRLTTHGIPRAPLLLAALVAGGCAVALAQLRSRAPRASQAARLIALFLALLIPAVGMYPSLTAFSSAAKERLVETQFGPAAASLRDTIQARLHLALDEIDGLDTLPDLVTSASEGEATTDRAFEVWQRTDLATYRITSAVELYGPAGRLTSRFALNLPEYTNAGYQASSCDWDLLEESSPFGPTGRHVLRASRAICDGETRLGSIVVRVMLDPRTLPFISSQNPYLESLRAPGQVPAESVTGRDVELVVYGWSGAPIYASGTGVWPLPEWTFQRLVQSRDAFWATLTRNDQSYRVYLINDRGGIYALGFPEITRFGHLINLAELVFLAAVLYVALLSGATLFNALTSRTPASGRALLREIRASFYRKLFLAFVAGAVVPVLILALAIRTYLANQLVSGIEEAAARTATVAQRLVEDYATLQQRGSGAFTSIDDQIMVLIGRAIDQDVNLFEGDALRATSERDLFASGLLSTRTPADVYRTIVLDRLPTFVGDETVGGFQYRLSAAPVRAADREFVVTVALTLRQQETERQIDELDRRVLFAAVLFSLLGAALGYWMAERIADPVSRLTRATRRIARGDLDAHIATASADELGRLVSDFNHMADDLKHQRAELERTQRLEAWADMARQVAHDIKNPLTPIQLSAEHARRVNIDRGRPLSPVLDDCVNAILGQVKLLRQISAEFSSFASSPQPRPEPTRLAEVIDDVVAPYRTGLGDRIRIDVTAPSDLPLVSIDRTLFARALTNIIENALHAMPGGGRLSIAARTTEAGGDRVVVVETTDTGVGMDQESVARLFEPYFSTKATGTGLGLTIAKRNVELNEGTIKVESRRGVGTTVTITLPLGSRVK